MANVDDGFLFGTKKSHWPEGGPMVHVEGKHPKYIEIRSDPNPHRLDTFDQNLQKLEQRLMFLLDCVRWLRANLIGGHVRRDKLASVQARLSDHDDPEEIFRKLNAVAEMSQREGL